MKKQNSKIYNYGKNGIVKTTRGGNNAKSNKSSGKMDSEQRTYSIPSSSKAPPPPKPKNKPFKYYNYGNDKLIEKSIPSTASTPPPPRREEREIPSTPKTPPPIKSNNNKK